MTIVRMFDNKEIGIELTEQEMMKAYMEYDHKGHIEDVKNHWDGEEEVPFTDEQAEEIATLAEKYLDKTDAYWNAYWEVIDWAIADWKNNNER